MRLFPGSSVARAVGVVGVVAVMAIAAGYLGAKSRQVEAAGHSYSSAVDLLLFDFKKHRWVKDVRGFRIRDMVAGEGSDQAVRIKNTGRKALGVAVRIPREPRWSYGFGGWGNVTLSVTSGDCDKRVDTTFQKLLSRTGVQLPCGRLRPSPSTRGYTFHFDILPDALSRADGQANIGNFDLEFVSPESTRP